MDDTPKSIALKWQSAYNRPDPEQAVALYDENVTNVQLPWGKAVQGREAMRATYEKLFQAFPDIRLEIENFVENNDWVAVEWRISGTMRGEFSGQPPNGRRFAMKGCELLHVVNAKIKSQHGYWDKATLLGQLGIEEHP